MLARAEKLAQRIAARSANHILMPDVPCARQLARQNDTVHGIGPSLRQSRFGKQSVIARGQCAARLGPCANVFELHRQHRALESIHARVPAQLVVVVAAAHAVLAQHLHPLGKLVGIRGDHAGVAGRAQVLGGIKAECGDIAQAARLHAIPLGAPGLRGVFDDGQPALSSRDQRSNRQSVHTDAPEEWRELPRRAGHRGRQLTAAGDRLKLTGSISASTGVAPARRIELTEAKKLNGVVTTAWPGAHARGGQRQPQGVGARRASQSMGHAQLLRGGFFECGHLAAKDELLRFEYPAERIQ